MVLSRSLTNGVDMEKVQVRLEDLENEPAPFNPPEFIGELIVVWSLLR